MYSRCKYMYIVNILWSHLHFCNNKEQQTWFIQWHITKAAIHGEFLMVTKLHLETIELNTIGLFFRKGVKMHLLVAMKLGADRFEAWGGYSKMGFQILCQIHVPYVIIQKVIILWLI